MKSTAYLMLEYESFVTAEQCRRNELNSARREHNRVKKLMKLKYQEWLAASGKVNTLTNEQRLKRQGAIFNHDGKCGKIVL